MNKYYSKELLEEVYKRYDSKCCNCGSTDNLDIHHIVPLSCGGTDRATNLVLVCQRCHQGLHHGHHIEKYRVYKNKGGRKRKVRDDSVYADYIHAKISVSEAREKTGCRIKDTFNFKDFMKENGIAKVSRNSGRQLNHQKSTIVFEDGRVEVWRDGVLDRSIF